MVRRQAERKKRRSRSLGARRDNGYATWTRPFRTLNHLKACYYGTWGMTNAAWATHLAPAEIRKAAFETIDRALVATIGYMEGRRAGKPQDQNHEWQLTELWNEASRALSPIDDPEVAKVADACIRWTDPEFLYQARVLHHGLQLLLCALQQ